MSSSNGTPPVVAGVEEAVRRNVAALYERVTTALVDNPDPITLSETQVQDLMALAGRLYADRRHEGERFAAFGPSQSEAELTATDGAVVASAVLDAVSVEIFELGIWKTWGTT